MSVRIAEAPPGGTLRYQLDSGAARLTPAERVVRGKAARAEVPPLPELVPVRYGRMMFACSAPPAFCTWSSTRLLRPTRPPPGSSECEPGSTRIKTR